MILYPPQSPIALNVLGYDIRWYGIVLAFSMLVGIIFCCKVISKKYSRQDADKFLAMVPLLIIFSLIGARWFYVLGDSSFYTDYPKEILMINHGGLSIFGAIFFGMIFLFVYSAAHKINLFKYADIIALVMPLCQAIGRWGNFCNQEAYGLPSDGFIKLFVDQAHRYPGYLDISYYHPAFLYESVLNLILFFILLIVYKKLPNARQGTIFYLYLISYSSIRIVTEGFRLDSIINVANIPVATLISFVILVVSLCLFLFSNKRFNN